MEPSGNPNVPKNPEPAPPGAETAPLPPAPEAQPLPSAAPPAPAGPAPAGPAPSSVNPGAQQPAADEKTIVPAGGNPSAAGDVDVIEKEWVDQANKIVEQTRDDPYIQEEAVESLQQDYLKKRYGHEVRKPGQEETSN